MENTNKQTYKVTFKGGTFVLIDAQTEKHARQAITRGRKVGRYTQNRIVEVKPLATQGLSGQ